MGINIYVFYFHVVPEFQSHCPRGCSCHMCLRIQAMSYSKAGMTLCFPLNTRLSTSCPTQVESALTEQHGCQTVLPRVPYKWPLALDLLKVQFQAYVSGHSLEVLTPYITIAPTIRLELWGVTGYITTDRENIHAILSTRFEDYGLGTRTLALFPFLGDGIFTQERSAWKRSRELMKRQFMRVQKECSQNLMSNIEDLVSTLRNAAAESDVVDLKPHLYDFTLGTTTKFLFCESLSALPKDERNAFRDAFDYASWVCGMRVRLADLASLCNTAKFRKACRVVKNVAGYFLDRALKHEAEFGEDEVFKKYTFIMELWSEMDDIARVRDQLLHVLLAGRDTTACLLSWIFFHLVQNPDILQRLQQEISTIPNSADITRKQIQDLPFLRCCLNETLRLYPQLPLNLRYANKATVLPRGGGLDGLAPVLIPKGSGVGWSAYHLHRNEPLYGPDAHLYNPQRWESGELMKRVRPGSGLLDFGGGPRVCLGSTGEYVNVSLLPDEHILADKKQKISRLCRLVVRL
jgi:cytochrome P450